MSLKCATFASGRTPVDASDVGDVATYGGLGRRSFDVGERTKKVRQWGADGVVLFTRRNGWLGSTCVWGRSTLLGVEDIDLEEGTKSKKCKEYVKIETCLRVDEPVAEAMLCGTIRTWAKNAKRAKLEIYLSESPGQRSTLLSPRYSGCSPSHSHASWHSWQTINIKRSTSKERTDTAPRSTYRCTNGAWKWTPLLKEAREDHEGRETVRFANGCWQHANLFKTLTNEEHMSTHNMVLLPSSYIRKRASSGLQNLHSQGLQLFKFPTVHLKAHVIHLHQKLFPGMHFVDAQEVTAKDLVISVEKLYIAVTQICSKHGEWFGHCYLDPEWGSHCNRLFLCHSSCRNWCAGNLCTRLFLYCRLRWNRFAGRLCSRLCFHCQEQL